MVSMTFARSRLPVPSDSTLMEGLGVVVVIGIIVAIAIPGLRHARMSGNEASAIASLRAINSAQLSYAAGCGNGFYAPTLGRLSTPPAMSDGDGFIGQDLQDDPSTKNSYMITLTAGAVALGVPVSCNGAASSTVVTTYFGSAAPLNGSGTYYFGTNQEGTIYRSTEAMAVTQHGAPAGATRLQ